MGFLRVLMIDDDQKLADLLKTYFKGHGIELLWADRPSEGRRRLQVESPDLLILDIMMPEQDGLSLCREFRAEGVTQPILMLTARGETTDRIVGLELGADDYMPKPFEPRELVARIQSIMRRVRGERLKPFHESTFGELVVSTDRRTAFLKGVDLDLTTAEFELLKLLTENPGRKFSRDEIMNRLRGVDSDVYSRSIDILVSRVRTKLGDTAKTPKYIKTVWGVGYVFLGEPAHEPS